MSRSGKVKFGGKFTVVKSKHDICVYEDSNGNITTWCSSEPFAEESEVYITKVLYNNPATIVFWNDGTKTIAKAHGSDLYSPEIGLMICCFKKLTSGSALKNLLADWVPAEYEFKFTGPIVRSISDVRKLHKSVGED